MKIDQIKATALGWLHPMSKHSGHIHL
uniref:Uncharacterized protein n=1 Tax=Rhizophora mucronata TaxID=61149 RepID=A0A2P2R1S8_RHIMU